MPEFGLLRPIRDDELDTMLSWRNAPDVRKNMYTRHAISADEHRAWWARTQGRADVRYFMYEHAGRALGIVSFSSIDLVNSNAVWAFYASPEAPRGTGSAMELLALEYVFEVLKLNKLSCEVLAFNTPVISLHRKFGFAVEGTFRQHHLVDGQFVDIIRLALLRTEWIAQHEAIAQRLRLTRTGSQTQ